MNNRFGFKDLIIVVLLVAVLVSIWIAMKMFDRQWEVMQAVQNQSREQTRTLIALNDTLRALPDASSPKAASAASAWG